MIFPLATIIAIILFADTNPRTGEHFTMLITRILGGSNERF